MKLEPRVLQFNDCAFVARSLVSAAARAGITWDYLPPEKVRPMRAGPNSRLLAKARFVPYVARRMSRLRSNDVVHVHYATSVRLIREKAMPKRPYVLTLHGTDIRRQWKEPQFHDEIQRAIDGAVHVFYANTDNQSDAVSARGDAEFFPSVIDLERLPQWTPIGRPQVMFISRWDEDKGVGRQLALAAELVKVLDGKADLVGLNWGPGAAEARARGVRLLDRMPQQLYYEQLGRSAVGIGQASNYFSTSEFEALSMGVPVAALGTRLPRPDDGTVPPVMEGDVGDVVQQVMEAIVDPLAASARLAGREWAVPRYSADNYIARLNELYGRAVAA